MREQIKQLWVKALLSGDYEQARGKLGQRVSGNGKIALDPLGILCEIAISQGVPVTRVINPKHGNITYDYEHSYLPDRVVEWAGLDNRKPVVRVSYENPETGERLANREAALTSINDGIYRDMGITGDFQCIAEIIEANF